MMTGLTAYQFSTIVAEHTPLVPVDHFIIWTHLGLLFAYLNFCFRFTVTTCQLFVFNFLMVTRFMDGVRAIRTSYSLPSTLADHTALDLFLYTDHFSYFEYGSWWWLIAIWAVPQFWYFCQSHAVNMGNFWTAFTNEQFSTIFANITLCFMVWLYRKDIFWIFIIFYIETFIIDLFFFVFFWKTDFRYVFLFFIFWTLNSNIVEITDISLPSCASFCQWL